MSRARKSATIPAPLPVPLDRVRQQAEALRAVPEVACAEAWSAACRAWWIDERDDRLRARSLATLLLSNDELAAWLDRRIDRATLIDAHRHVTSSRAGVERDLSRRFLSPSGLRERTVLVEHRGGARTVFTAAEDVPVLVERLCTTAAALPELPLVRAAWLIQAIGAVHPFPDANGGTSRFIASLELVRAHLPALVLSGAQRGRSYIDALMDSNTSGELGGLVLVLHDAIQQTLAAALLAGTGDHAAWDERASARAAGWIDAAAQRWRSIAGTSPEGANAHELAGAALSPVIARLVRRGLRLPIAPAPRAASWHAAASAPTHIDLAIVPLRGGPTTWLVAMLAASFGEHGELGAIHGGEPISAMFVAPATEPDAIVEARFQRWVAGRLDQCIRGLASWM